VQALRVPSHLVLVPQSLMELAVSTLELYLNIRRITAQTKTATQMFRHCYPPTNELVRLNSCHRWPARNVTKKPAAVIIPDFIDFSSVDLPRGRLNSVETIGSTASSESQERYFQDECSKYAAKKELERSSSTGVSPTNSSNKSVGFVKLATLTYGKPVPKRGRHRAVSFSQMITEEQGGRRVCHNSHFAGCVAAPLASALPSPPVDWVAPKKSDKSIGQFLQSICSGQQRSREKGDVGTSPKNNGNNLRKGNSHQSKKTIRPKPLPKSKRCDVIQAKSTTKPRRQFDHSRNQKHRGFSKVEKAEIHDNNKNDNKKIGILHKPDGSGDGPSSIPGNVMSFFEAFKQSSKK